MNKVLFLLALLFLTCIPAFCDENEDLMSVTGKAREGDFAGALADCNKVIKSNPSSARAYLLRGTIRRNIGDLDGALFDYNYAIKLQPGNAIGYTYRGNLEAQKGDSTNALADFNTAIDLSVKYAPVTDIPGNQERSPDYNASSDFSPRAEAYLNRAQLRFAKGDWDGALADCHEALQINPNFARAYAFRSILEQGRGDYDDALTDCNRAIKLGPRYSYSYLSRAFLERRTGDFQFALADYNTAIWLDPRNCVLYVDRGLFEFQKHDWDDASIDYNKAIQLNPSYAEAYSVRGDLERREGQLPEALADCNKAIKLNPENVDAYSIRGLTKRAMGNLDDALADANTAVKLNSKDVRALIDRSVIKYNKGDGEGAFADCQEVLRINSKNTRADYVMGCFYSNSHQFTNALAVFRQVNEFDPETKDYAEFRLWLIQARLGRQEKATEELQNYWKNQNNGIKMEWLPIICQFLTGEITEQNFLKAAESTDRQKDTDQHCEAFFYAASKRLIAGDKTGATIYFQKCLATNDKSFLEYQSAKAELKFLQSTNS